MYTPPVIRPLSSSFSVKDNSSDSGSPRPPRSARERPTPPSELAFSTKPYSPSSPEARLPQFTNLPSKLYAQKYDQLKEQQHDEEQNSLSMLNILPAKSKHKHLELGHKITEVDKELAKQSAVRKKRMAQVNSLEQKHVELNEVVYRLQTAVEKIEDKLNRFETILNQEKSSRELQGKLLQASIEEKYNALYSKLENEKSQRSAENDLLKKSIRAIEDFNTGMQMKITSMHQDAKEISAESSRLSQMLNELKRTLDSDSSQKDDTVKSLSKQLMALYNELKQQIYQEQATRKQATDQLAALLAKDAHEFNGKLADLSLSVEQTISSVSSPLRDQLERLNEIFVKEKKTREEFLKLHEQTHLKLDETMKDLISKEASRMDEAIKNQERIFNQKHWNLQQIMEKDVEQGQKNYYSLMKMIGDAEKKRTDSEESLLSHITSILTRIRSGMEMDDDLVHLDKQIM